MGTAALLQTLGLRMPGPSSTALAGDRRVLEWNWGTSQEMGGGQTQRQLGGSKEGPGLGVLQNGD